MKKVELFVSGWQMGDTSLSESPEEEEDSPTADKGSCSPQMRPPSAPSDHWHGSPRKRTQTLPTFNCPLSGMAAKAEALNRWSRIQESSEEKCGTLSEDIFKILDLQGSGSLFRRSQIKTDEAEETLTSQTGSDNPGSSSDTTGDEKAEKGVAELPESGSARQAESRVEQKNHEQQLSER